LGKPLGIAATGHVETSKVAAEVLKAGGNAFDAAIAALCVACVAEPLLASLGGGGYLLSRTGSGQACLYDFFCQTPARRRPESELDFYPITANFGTDTQDFHVGMGAMAVPGTVAGLYQIHGDLGRIPMPELMQPAIDLARKGVRVDALHHYIMQILEAILRADDVVFGLFESPSTPGSLINKGELLVNPAMADAMTQLAGEGQALFYQGEWAEQLIKDHRDYGGGLTREDLSSYRVERRQPLSFSYRGSECLINPPPSPGGCLIAFALGLLNEGLPTQSSWGEPDHVRALVTALRATSLARVKCDAQMEETPMEQLLTADSLAQWRDSVQWHSLFSRGTTHISIADSEGNLASLTASNGEGNTYALPGSGIIFNNMLGEEDLNTGGFNRWREGERLASMMSPTMILGADGSRLAMGTGGSNRIRSAIAQVLVNILDFELPLNRAVSAPRLHLENERLSIETGYGDEILSILDAVVPEVHQWPEQNLFFGGVHAVRINSAGEFEGAGDPRRNGSVKIA
jgi:gamma-glutamyltranspeptidase/glutathione hydrolase